MERLIFIYLVIIEVMNELIKKNVLFFYFRCFPSMPVKLFFIFLYFLNKNEHRRLEISFFLLVDKPIKILQ